MLSGVAAVKAPSTQSSPRDRIQRKEGRKEERVSSRGPTCPGVCFCFRGAAPLFCDGLLRLWRCTR
ncbi:trans-sialidase, putative, partial [Trypanosoma cruzi]